MRPFALSTLRYAGVGFVLGVAFLTSDPGTVPPEGRMGLVALTVCLLLPACPFGRMRGDRRKRPVACGGEPDGTGVYALGPRPRAFLYAARPAGRARERAAAHPTSHLLRRKRGSHAPGGPGRPNRRNGTKTKWPCAFTKPRPEADRLPRAGQTLPAFWGSVMPPVPAQLTGTPVRVCRRRRHGGRAGGRITGGVRVQRTSDVAWGQGKGWLLRRRTRRHDPRPRSHGVDIVPRPIPIRGYYR
jgi:hypothetical protein